MQSYQFTGKLPGNCFYKFQISLLNRNNWQNGMVLYIIQHHGQIILMLYSLGGGLSFLTVSWMLVRKAEVQSAYSMFSEPQVEEPNVFV